MKLVILRLGNNESFATLPPEIQAQIVSYQATWFRIGKSANGYYVVDAMVDDSFDPTVLGSYGLQWALLGLWQWDFAPSTTETVDQPPVVVSAGITDTTTEYESRYSRFFVRNICDAAGNAVGVECLDDFGNVVETVPGGVVEPDGSYIMRKGVPAKLVPGVGVVAENLVTAAGSYTHQATTVTHKSSMKTLIPFQSGYITHMPDVVDTQGNATKPTKAKEVLRWGGWPERKSS